MVLTLSGAASVRRFTHKRNSPMFEDITIEMARLEREALARVLARIAAAQKGEAS